MKVIRSVAMFDKNRWQIDVTWRAAAYSGFEFKSAAGF
jgi:hypothetical protein